MFGKGLCRAPALTTQEHIRETTYRNWRALGGLFWSFPVCTATSQRSLSPFLIVGKWGKPSKDLVCRALVIQWLRQDSCFTVLHLDIAIRDHNVIKTKLVLIINWFLPPCPSFLLCVCGREDEHNTFFTCLLVKLFSNQQGFKLGVFDFYLYVSEGGGNTQHLPYILYKVIAIFFFCEAKFWTKFDLTRSF